LSLSRNNINDISPVQNLTNLETLLFEHNEVSDISSLVSNTGLGKGDRIFMKDNNLDLSDDSQDMKNIQTLIDRGCRVGY